MAVMWVEVEVIEGAEGNGSGIENARGRYWCIPVLKLRVSLDRQVVSKVVVEA